MEKVITVMDSLEGVRDCTLETLRVINAALLTLSELRADAVKSAEVPVIAPVVVSEPVNPVEVPVIVPVVVSESVNPVEVPVVVPEPVNPVEVPVIVPEPVEVPAVPVVVPVEAPVVPVVVPVEVPVVVIVPTEPEEEPVVVPMEEPIEEPVELADDVVETVAPVAGVLGLTRPPVNGAVTACLVSINWTDKVGPSPTVAGKTLEKVYNNAAQGHIAMKVTTKTVNVPFKHLESNLYPAKDFIKTEVIKANKNVPYDIYILIHSDIRSYSNATGGVAYVKNTLIRDVLHETGHLLPFGLQHANMPNVGIVSGAYKDPTSFMGKYSTWQFNGANLMYLGWMPKDKIAVHNSGTMEYLIEPLYKEKIEDGISVINAPGTAGSYKIIVLQQPGKDLILSTAVIGKEFYYVLHETFNGKVVYEIGAGTILVLKFRTVASYGSWKFEKKGVMLSITKK